MRQIAIGKADFSVPKLWPPTGHWDCDECVRFVLPGFCVGVLRCQRRLPVSVVSYGCLMSICRTGSTWISSLHCWGRLHGGQQDQHMALISKQLQQSPFQIVKGFLTMVVVCSKQNLPQSVISIHIKIERLYKHTWCSILWVGDQ
jgi:hypothetical protein